VDAAQALADLTEISSQIEAVVIVEGEGSVVGSTLEDGERALGVADGAPRLRAQAAAAAPAHEPGEHSQLEAATPHGSVFVVRDDARTIVATTGPEPTVGLVFYDLKSCLRSLATDEQPAEVSEPEPEAKPKPKPRRPRKPKEPADGAA
jgi:predicted regulator of Ras-like GTPase activity (Roadblock/LC7/MglB family)